MSAFYIIHPGCGQIFMKNILGFSYFLHERENQKNCIRNFKSHQKKWNISFPRTIIINQILAPQCKAIPVQEKLGLSPNRAQGVAHILRNRGWGGSLQMITLLKGGKGKMITVLHGGRACPNDDSITQQGRDISGPPKVIT